MPPRDRDPAGLEQIVSELSLRTLEEQRHDIRDIRTSAGILLAAGSLAATFLGGDAASDRGAGFLTATAIVAFAVSFLATLYVLLPNRNLYFALDSRLLHRILRDSGDLQDAHRRLSTWALDLYERNGAALDLLHWAYRLAVLGLATQVLSWSAGAVLDL